jgi:hypothetical protein
MGSTVLLDGNTGNAAGGGGGGGGGGDEDLDWGEMADAANQQRARAVANNAALQSQNLDWRNINIDPEKWAFSINGTYHDAIFFYQKLYFFIHLKKNTGATSTSASRSGPF